MYSIVGKVVDYNKGYFNQLNLKNLDGLEHFMDKNLGDEILLVYS